MSEILVKCPYCLRAGFTVRGIKVHNCPARRGDRLPLAEAKALIAEAERIDALQMSLPIAEPTQVNA